MRARYYVPKVLFLSAKYSFRFRHRPFRKWYKTIGTEMYESRRDIPCDIYMRRVALAVDRVCSKTPWESKCMVRALTAKKMLNGKGYPCTLYMGVKNDESKNMIAHAWLRCGETYITGGDGKEYTVTGIFGDE